jgi:hypothetical protein
MLIHMLSYSQIPNGQKAKIVTLCITEIRLIIIISQIIN